MDMATIKSLSIRRSKGGDDAVQVEALVEEGEFQGKYAKEWIGSKAPDFIGETWEAAIGSNPLQAVKDGDGWKLLGLPILVEVENTDYGLKIKKVKNKLWADSIPENQDYDPKDENRVEIKDDDIPF